MQKPQTDCGLRSQELLALADVIKILNYDDHAYEHFHLKNKKLTYTVDDSNLDYSLTGALYFVHMDWDGDQSKYGNVDAELDIVYRHAQCPHDLKFVNGEANNEDWKPSEMDVNSISGKYGSCCTKIDLWEANKISTAYTVHLCDGGEQTRCSGTDCGDDGPGRFKGTCDKNGCDIQSSYLGNPKFFRLGPDLQVDSTKPITVTDTGKLVEVKQFYVQNGKTIEHPEYSVLGNKHKTITDSFCADWIGTTKDGTTFAQKGGLAGIEKVLDAGVVLVTSMWDDYYAIMLWLDSTYPTDSTAPGSKRGSCATTSGVPTAVESQQASAHVIFSDIKFGPLGSTTGGVAPAKSALNCAELVRTWFSAKYWLTVQCPGWAAMGELPAGGQETAALTCRVGPAGDSLHYCPPWVQPEAAAASARGPPCPAGSAWPRRRPPQPRTAAAAASAAAAAAAAWRRCRTAPWPDRRAGSSSWHSV